MPAVRRYFFMLEIEGFLTVEKIFLGMFGIRDTRLQFFWKSNYVVHENWSIVIGSIS